MISRALWTTVLALLAWIPIGRGQAWALRGDLRDRAVLTESALEVAADSPSRTASPTQARIAFAATKRPSAPRSLVSTGGATPLPARAESRAEAPCARQSSVPWRGFRAKRLIFPHDAIAPPPRRS